MNAAFAYFLAGSAGAYAAGIYAMLTGRWQTPTRPEWWLLVPAIAAFAVDRAYADFAFVAAPITFVCCALLFARMLSRTHGTGARGALWFLFAAVPLALTLVIVIGDFFPQPGGAHAVRAAAWLLALPGLAAPAACAARVTLRSPRT